MPATACERETAASARRARDGCLSAAFVRLLTADAPTANARGAYTVRLQSEEEDVTFEAAVGALGLAEAEDALVPNWL